MYALTSDVEFVRRTDRLHPPELAALSTDLRGWLTTAAVPETVHPGVLAAIEEAVRNAARHAYRHRPGPIAVHATVQQRYRRLTVLVHDRGRWRPPPAGPAGPGGGGLARIEQLATATAVHPSATGTTVSMLWQLPPWAGSAGAGEAAA